MGIMYFNAASIWVSSAEECTDIMPNAPSLRYLTCQETKLNTQNISHASAKVKTIERRIAKRKKRLHSKLFGIAVQSDIKTRSQHIYDFKSPSARALVATGSGHGDTLFMHLQSSVDRSC